MESTKHYVGAARSTDGDTDAIESTTSLMAGEIVAYRCMSVESIGEVIAAAGLSADDFKVVEAMFNGDLCHVTQIYHPVVMEGDNE